MDEPLPQSAAMGHRMLTTGGGLSSTFSVKCARLTLAIEPGISRARRMTMRDTGHTNWHSTTEHDTNVLEDVLSMAHTISDPCESLVLCRTNGSSGDPLPSLHTLQCVGEEEDPLGLGACIG